MEKQQKSNPLLRAYEMIHENSPEGLKDWEIAERIIEVLDNEKWVPKDLAQQCLYYIVHIINYPNKAIKTTIIKDVESIACNIFPELKGIDEVHMDQIEYYYLQRYYK